MKKTIMLIMGMMTVSLSCIAQVGGARVNQWILGVNTNIWPSFDIKRLYFGLDTTLIEGYDYGCGFGANNGIAISDLQGNLQFVTNGIVVMNAQGDTVNSANGFNSGYISSTDPYYGNSLKNIVLTHPGNPLQYIIIHASTGNTDINTLPNCCWQAAQLKLRHSIIDMSTGTAEMIVKDSLFLSDTLSGNSYFALKHANGRDWWLLVPRLKQDSILTFLLSPSGISQPFIQSGLGAWTMFPSSINMLSYSQFYISPNNTKIAAIYPRDGLSLYDFDRCTGYLSNRKSITIPNLSSLDIEQWIRTPCVFSPNSKLLYTSTVYGRIYQFNLDTVDIESSALLLRDSMGIDYYIGDMRVSPEEIPKIYCFRTNTPFIDVIPFPNLRGMNSVFLEGKYSTELIPYPHYDYPNYSLGPLIGSGCDTLTSSIGTAVIAAKVEVYPNPTDGEITVAFESKYGHSGRFMCYNPLGQVCKAIELAHSPSKVSLSDLPTGLYFWEFEGQKGKLWVR